MLSLEQGKKLVKLAKNTISNHLNREKQIVNEALKKEFGEKQGVFVTLTKKRELRGCIGFPEPMLQLWDGVVQAALAAAFEDPRFNPVQEEELKEIEIEISVLTKPELVKVKEPKEYLKTIKVGRDGLVVRGSYGSGLLLPQVAPEWGWNVEEFLQNTCNKAGLAKDCWKDLNNKVYSFQAQIFTEKNGKVVEKVE
jgi:uncharacterized protein (TIGR00296 family)